ncbi:MAG: cytochrome c oxidase subunit II [Candidatus Bipolaricaulia bacterium]
MHNRYTRLFSIAVLVLLAALLGGSAVAFAQDGHPQSTFDAAGPVAERQRDLLWFIIWVAVGILVVVEGALIYAIIRYRRRPRQAGEPEPVHGHSGLEISWTIAPVLIVAAIGVFTVRTIFDLSSPPVPDALQIKVTAYQWWWEFQYPDAEVVTANELHIPVGQVVNLNIESQDVIHSFWVPKLAGKMDAIPNQLNQLWLRADQSGIYWGQCAEFCGIAHAFMRFRVIAQPEDEFQAWLQVQQQPAVTLVDDLARKGAEIFARSACIGCHTVAGTLAQGKIGPDLTHFGDRTTLGAGILDNNPENLADWLRDPQAVKPGNRMPNLNLSEDEISALAAYLQSLK